MAFFLPCQARHDDANGYDHISIWAGASFRLRWLNGEGARTSLDIAEPGRSIQNGFTGRFNDSFRRGVLDMHVFRNFGKIREQA